MKNEEGKLPTAKQYLDREAQLLWFGRQLTAEEELIGFAKLHTKAALNAAASNARTKTVTWGLGEYEEVDKDSILDAYPEELIK